MIEVIVGTVCLFIGYCFGVIDARKNQDLE